MINEDKLPKDYEPFRVLDFCGNTLENVSIPFTFKNMVPLLIGKGSIPRVWLNAPTGKDLTQWVPLVRDNIAQIKEIEIFGDKKKASIEVRLNKTPILRANVSGDRCTCGYLDLRPIGLKISGDSSALTFGGSTFSRNHFSGLKVMIGVG